MRVAAFMIPAKDVVTVGPEESIRKCMDLMLAKKIGAVVVLIHTDQYHCPIGIVTKTDILRAYHDNVRTYQPVKDIMSKNLDICTEDMNRDQAARVLEKNKNHHAIVVDSNDHFQGLVSSWDITVECAKDDRAWPWNRSEDGKFHKPSEAADTDILGTSPTSSLLHPNSRPVTSRGQMGDSFRAYVDNLGYFD